MDESRPSGEGQPNPKKKLRVARETLRQLGTLAMRGAAGGTQ